MFHDAELADAVVGLYGRIPHGKGGEIPLVAVAAVGLVDDALMICLNNSEILEC